MSQPHPRERTSPHWTLVSAALFVLGLAIFLTFGLCTAMMGYFTLLEVVQVGDFSGLLLILILGGIPMAVGAVLIYAGLKTRRRD